MKRLFAALMLGMTMLLAGCGQINEGNVGVRTNLGGTIDQKPLGTGFYLAVTSSVDEFTTKEVQVPFKGLKPKAKDNLTLDKLDLAIYYTTNGEAIPKFQSSKTGMSAKKDGIYYAGYRLIENMALGTINDSVSRFESLKLHTQRDGLENDIKTRLQAQLNESDPGFFTITRVVVSVLDTDDSVEQSIRDKVQADMRLETATKEVKIKEQLALANKATNVALTPEFLQLRYIEAITECAKNAGCTLLVDGTQSGSTSKILNVR